MDAPVDPFVRSLITKIVVILLILVLLYFMIVRPILQKVGIIKTAEDKQREKEEEQLGTSTDSPFSPKYWQNIPGALLLTKASAEKMADTIEGAVGDVWDDENTVYGVLKQLKSKTQLSFLADIFYQRHKMDLYQLIRRNFSDSEMEIVNSIASKLA
jgi:hypothetical protein